MNNGAISEIQSSRGRRRLSICLRGLLIIHTLIGIACVAQQYYGLGWTQEHRIHPDDIRKIDDLYRWQLPEDYRGWLMNRRAWLHADGQPFLNRSLSNRDLHALRDGWFHVRSGYLRFVPQDGSDPRRNRVRYTLLTPRQFEPELWWAIGGGLLLLVLANNAMRCRFRDESHPAEQDLPPPTARRLVTEASVIVIFTLAVLSLHLHLGHQLTDHAFAIKDVPESDAAGWYHMAEDLADGHGLRGGFEAQRPFYTILLGACFHWFGVSLAVAKAFNAGCLAVATAGLWLLGRLYGSRLIALTMALLTLLGGLHLDYVHGILTENAGLPFAVLALATVWVASQSGRRLDALTAGIINALGNLASGVTLLTLPYYAIWLGLESYRRSRYWRTALVVMIVYTAGATLVIGPWLIRQLIVHDRLTLSYNTAEVLAGGADLTEGKLTTKAFDRAREAGVDLTDVDARYDYFMQEFRSSIAAHPQQWLAQVLKASEHSLRWMPNSEPGFRFIALLSLLCFGLTAAIRQGRWIALLIALALMVLWARSGFALSLPLLLGSATLLIALPIRVPVRSLTILLLGTCLCTMLLSGLSGNVAAKRFWIVSDWSGTLLVIAASWHLIDWASRTLHEHLQRALGTSWFAGPPAIAVARRSHQAKLPAIRCLSALLISLSTLCLISVAAASLHGPPSRFSGLLPPSLTTVVSALSQHLPPDFHLPTWQHPAIASHIVRLDDLHLSLAAGEGTQHWLPQYEKKPYPHWVAQVTLLGQDGHRVGDIAACGTGSLDSVQRAWPLLFCGVATYPRDHIGNSPFYVLQTLSITPMVRDPSGSWQPDWPHTHWFSPSPDALSAFDKAPPP